MSAWIKSGLKGAAKGKGFSLLELLGVLAVSAFLFVIAIQEIIRRHDRQIATGLVARQVAGFTNGVRQRLSYADAVERFNQASQTLNGITWLQAPTCGGTAPIQFLPCSFPSSIAQAGDLLYSTEIKNTAGRLTAIISIKDVNGKGYQLRGGLRADLAGATVIAAAGYQVSTVTPVGLVTFARFESDPLTAIIKVEVDTNSAADPWLRTDGSNSMNADLGFSGAGYDLLNANDLEASSMTDKEDSNFWLDPSDTSQVNLLNANTINADLVQAENLRANNAGFAAATIGELELGSLNTQYVVSDLATADAFIDKENSDYFINPAGMSQVHDLIIGSRGGVPLSALLPKMVLMSSHWVKHNDLVSKPQCAETGFAKIFLVAATSQSFLREAGVDSGRNHTKIAAETSLVAYRAKDEGAEWKVKLLSYDYQNSDYLETPGDLSEAIAKVYCQYP